MKNFAYKALSVLLCALLSVGIIPAIPFTANAESVAPVYDSSLGTYTESNGILTAAAYDNCGFRGWFDKAGNEVSVEKSFTLPSGKTKDDFIPVFYNFNLVKDSGFENYSVGADLENASVTDENWFDKTDNGATWPSVIVSTDYAKSGTKSARISAKYNMVYRNFEGLEKNKQYTVKFYYYIPDIAAGVLKYASVIGENMTLVNHNANKGNVYLAEYFNNEKCKEGEWKEVKMTFYTGDNTSAKLCLHFITEDADKPYLYLDDLSLVKDEFSAPVYGNQDFESYSASNWTNIGGVSLNPDGDYSNFDANIRLKVQSSESYAKAQSPVILLKKGYKYTFSFEADLSALSSRSNYFNWSVVSKKGSAGSADDGTFFIAPANSSAKPSTTIKVKRKGTLSSSYSDYSPEFNTTLGNGYSIWDLNLGDQCKDGYYTYDLSKTTVTITFTAPETKEAYLNIWLNNPDTFYVDNLTVTEQGTSNDTLLMDNAVKSVGTAIRTEGKQGIRFKTEIDKRLLTADNDFGVRVTEYGTVAIRSEYLNGEELVLDKNYTLGDKSFKSRKGVAYSLEDNKEIIFEQNNSTIKYTAVLMNIVKDYWNSGYTVRSYLKYKDVNGNEKTLYTKPSESSIFAVSKEAYTAKNKDGSFAESASVREYLYNDILSLYTDKNVTINNGSTPYISESFKGINSTVYHCYTFMDDAHGRTYTDDMARVEMDRLVDSGITNVRTVFKSQFAWDSSTNKWNWDSKDMQAVYKWAKMLQQRGITITLNAGWHIYDFIYYYDYNKNNNANKYSENGHSSIPEVDYLHGVGTAVYGEDAKAAVLANMSGTGLTANELAHYSVAAARYGEWIKQALQQFKSHGVNNVKYVIPFTESGDFVENDPTYSYGEWLVMTVGLHNALKDAGIRNNYKLIGPGQSLYSRHNRQQTLLDFTLKFMNSNADYENLIDILSSHQYSYIVDDRGNIGTIYEPYNLYNNTLDNFNYYNNEIAKNGASDMEFWCDEFFAQGSDAHWKDGVGMQMTQFAAGLTAAMNTGVDSLVSWQLFDTNWLSTGTNKEFVGGVHAVGTCPSLCKVNDTCTVTNCDCKNYNEYSSYTPRVTYYGINLLGKYLNNKHAKVYSTSVSNGTDADGGLYVSSIKSDDGSTVLLVVNTTAKSTNVTFKFEGDNDGDFTRYTYNPNGITPTEAATSLPSDGTVTVTDGSFYDSIAPGSFAIYVQKSSIIDNDVNMDAGELD